MKAESELLTTTIMLYPAGMVTCVNLDLMQEQEIFFAKLLCNRQRTSVILIIPLTSSSVSGCLLATVSIKYFANPKYGSEDRVRAVYFYLIGLHEERFPNQDCRAGLSSLSYANDDHAVLHTHIPINLCILIQLQSSCFLKCPLTLSHKNVWR